MQPVLTTVTDTVSTLSNDVAGTIAPVEAAAQPVLATVTDTVGTLSNDTDLLQPAVPDTSTGQAPGPADTLLALATATDAPIEVPGIRDGRPGQRCNGRIECRGGRRSDRRRRRCDRLERRATASRKCSVHRNPVYRLRSHAEQRHRRSPAACRVLRPTPHRLRTLWCRRLPMSSNTRQRLPISLDTTPSIDHLGLRDAVL